MTIVTANGELSFLPPAAQKLLKLPRVFNTQMTQMASDFLRHFMPKFKKNSRETPVKVKRYLLAPSFFSPPPRVFGVVSCKKRLRRPTPLNCSTNEIN